MTSAALSQPVSSKSNTLPPPPPPPPTPLFVIRTHTTSISATALSPTALHLASGDDDGVVALSAMRTMRCDRRWQAHSGTVLSLEWLQSDKVGCKGREKTEKDAKEGETGSRLRLLTHGRDSMVRLWMLAGMEGADGADDGGVDVADNDTDTTSQPTLLHEFYVNALNFCNVSLCNGRYLAAAHLADSARVDIWDLDGANGVDRIHRSIGVDSEDKRAADGRGDTKTGLCMKLHLYQSGHRLRLLSGYEDGSLILYECDNGSHWNVLWRVRKHLETVMGLCVSYDLRYAYSVSVDRHIVRYELDGGGDSNNKNSTNSTQSTIFNTPTNGHASIAVRRDGRLLAVGCWSGSVQLYSAKSGKLVGVLDLHRQSVSTLAFSPLSKDETEAEVQELDNSVIERPLHELLVTGARDDRVAVYAVDL